ncbi:hypothetical protein VUR80DRAFT_4988 [Thermomyces stellatus]
MVDSPGGPARFDPTDLVRNGRTNSGLIMCLCFRPPLSRNASPNSTAPNDLDIQLITHRVPLPSFSPLSSRLPSFSSVHHLPPSSSVRHHENFATPASTATKTLGIASPPNLATRKQPTGSSSETLFPNGSSPTLLPEATEYSPTAPLPSAATTTPASAQKSHPMRTRASFRYSGNVRTGRALCERPSQRWS